MSSCAFIRRDARGGRPGHWIVLSLVFVLALLFMDGVQVAAWHHHDAGGPDPHCLACRVVGNPAGAVPQDVTAAALVLPGAPEPLAVRDLQPVDAPHLVLPRLRAPPSA